MQGILDIRTYFELNIRHKSMYARSSFCDSKFLILSLANSFTDTKKVLCKIVDWPLFCDVYI